MTEGKVSHLKNLDDIKVFLKKMEGKSLAKGKHDKARKLLNKYPSAFQKEMTVNDLKLEVIKGIFKLQDKKAILELLTVVNKSLGKAS